MPARRNPAATSAAAAYRSVTSYCSRRDGSMGALRAAAGTASSVGRWSTRGHHAVHNTHRPRTHSVCRPTVRETGTARIAGLWSNQGDLPAVRPNGAHLGSSRSRTLPKSDPTPAPWRSAHLSHSDSTENAATRDGRWRRSPWRVGNRISAPWSRLPVTWPFWPRPAERCTGTDASSVPTAQDASGHCPTSIATLHLQYRRR
jgi:hypothetical protein